MSYKESARKATRRTRTTFLVGLIAVAFMGVLGCRSLAGSSSGASPTSAGPSAHRTQERFRSEVPRTPPGEPPGEHDRPPGVADGVVPAGTTVFNDDLPALTNLDPSLLRALRRAATDAAGDGVEFYVNSGWRSRTYQKALLDEAIAKYGSRQEAARWVDTPNTSAHVSGDAVDIGQSDATAWLSLHGAQYGLCQIYQNEPWHYELRPEAVDHGCPALYADPTQDPRTQQ